MLRDMCTLYFEIVREVGAREIAGEVVARDCRIRGCAKFGITIVALA